ncbi:PREDICTED: LRR receptor-like serine/threonine-protein kinase GSO1 [Populus euphratica]|uniref:LRR receptor-like serine/threonine-protein kinase GSO1 n=1 Tax=Populus euphratica TaxID=75702 RepID=A0AAJ6TGE8_POPEU|nr:PREDICTED: LRR receptor-like serine/threonine-protein kinase GSO1 [Populus euphratica]
MGAWMLLALLTLVGDWCGRCYGCLEHERIGLLKIKALTNPNSIYMGDWVEYSSNCCEWSGIECDNTTRRVVWLSLSGARDQSLGDWVLNASLFLPFKELQRLALVYNGLVGCSENQGFEVLSSKLRKLEVLDLILNKFNDKSILSCFNGLSSLKSLYLSDNQLTGSGSFYGLKVLSSRLKKLENLYLRGNQCNDSIFSSLSGFSSLKSLDLSYNEVITGSGLKVLSSRLKKLENLDLFGNQCNDSIFSSLSGFSSLKSLDLSGNLLTGSSTGINSFQLQPMRLGKSENLNLSANQLNSSILSILSGLSSLKSLDLSLNKLTGSGSKDLSSLTGLKKLENLVLRGNQCNDSIFSSRSGFSSLKSFYLSGNQLTGSGLKVLSSRLKKLENLDLRGNQCNDSIFSSLSGFSSLKSLDLSDNQLTGSGLKVLSSRLKKLENLDLFGNQCNDSIFSSLSGFSSLKSLDLSGNLLTGSSTGINSFQVLASGLRNLEELYLSDNKLNDSVLSSLSGFSTLKSLDLSSNRFTGSTGLNGLRKLEILYLESSDFKESILIESLGALPSLKTLHASSSTFKHFGKGLSNSSSLEEVFLGSSSLPAGFLRNIGHWSTLKVLSLPGVDLRSTLPAEGTFFNSSTLEELYLDYISLPLNFLQNIGALPALKELHAGYCDLNGTLPAQGLRKLEILYLSSNDFKESIFIESLGALPSLKTLHARNSKFKHVGKGLSNSSSLEEVVLDGSSLPASFLRNIGHSSTLKVLSLTTVDFHSTLPAQGTFFNSSTLEELHLDLSSLPLNFLQNIGALPALKELYAGSCDLNGTLPAQGWCELKNLEEVDLSGNNLKGVLPPCLGNLSSLRSLDLSYNQLEGNIASSHLSHLTQLGYLSVSNNYFQVPISFGSFMNLSNLKFIVCDSNELIAAPSSQPLVPKFQLLLFRASNCTPKPLEAGFPNFLHSQHDLVVVDLSHNKFVGQPFPSWLFENNTKLNRLYLRDTSITGPLQLPQHPTPSLQTVDMSSNNIHGQVARNICSIFPRLKNFMMANNSLTGCIPPCFGNMSCLQYLDLSNNHMSCELLEHNLPTVGSSLWFLKLSNNSFNGRLPPSVFNMTDLHYLLLDGNKFVEVPGTFSLESSLLWLDISNNLLSGMLPRGIGNSSKTQLHGIDLSRNQFEGTIPIEYFNSSALQFLDLSENNLSGSLPLGFNATSLRYVHLYGNRLSGPLPYDFYNLSSLVTLDLGDNNLTGPIPNWIVLKSNQFNGKLPHQLCLLRKFSILDLSENNFSGLLPSCLSNLNFTASDEKTFDPPRTEMSDGGIQKDIFASIGGRELENEGFYPYEGVLWPEISVKIAVELTSKKNFYTYEGDILRYMSVMDLSCNRFTGQIPTEWGNLSGIYSLNLSQNNLTGLIPPSFSNLKQIESLDLSHNNLNGRIPSQLVELTFLAVFNVSYNNLSGRTPEMKNQFGTFDESSYKGNPLLCGPPLQNRCDKTESPSARVPNDFNGDGGFIDMYSFYASFGVCYIIAVLTIAAVLCINPHRRRRWFYFIEECIDTCYCFLAINFRKLSRFRR